MENKKNLTDQAYDQLLDMLMKGSYRPGEKIPSENDLKNLLGVSRNTIRAALNRLNVQGVLETRKGDGTYVIGVGPNLYLNSLVPSILINSDDLMGLMEFRRGVETASARLAACNATDEDLRNLEQYFDTLQNHQIDNHEFANMTSDFHVKIAAASKNDLFVSVLKLIKWIITAKMESFLYYKPNVADSSFYHYMIYRCIKQRKPDEAAYMMDRHMGLLLQRVDSYATYVKEHSQEDLESLKEQIIVTNIFGKEEDPDDEQDSRNHESHGSDRI